MKSVVMVCCAGAICQGIRGWFFPMWVMLILASVVAGADLLAEAKRQS
jgi:hypothetical protein